MTIRTGRRVMAAHACEKQQLSMIINMSSVCVRVSYLVSRIHIMLCGYLTLAFNLDLMLMYLHLGF